MRRLTVLYHKTVPRVEYSLTHTHIPTPRQNLHHFTMVWPRHELHISIYLVTIGLLLSYSTLEAIYNLLSIFYIVHVVCPHLRQQRSGSRTRPPHPQRTASPRTMSQRAHATSQSCARR